jgi:hypothetical protein
MAQLRLQGLFPAGPVKPEQWYRVLLKSTAEKSRMIFGFAETVCIHPNL